MFERLSRLLTITRSFGILRRYFVVNGFDGALTMLGLITGFYASDNTAPATMISACMGAAIALGISGVSSAYVSEAAEKRKELLELEQAMITDLKQSPQGQATRLLPLVIALVNGLAPLLFCLIIISPIWIFNASAAVDPSAIVSDPFLHPVEISILLALSIIFFLGVFLGRISHTFWLWSGLRTLLIAAVTVLIIMLINPG
jgi:predicted membrane protein (TIGR00267 family)